MIEFEFEQPAWKSVLKARNGGTSLSAAHFLAMMEQEPQGDFEEALNLLDQLDILLDTSDLPAYPGDTELAKRLSMEMQLVQENKLLHGLEENDPLRLYLEEISAVSACADLQTLVFQCGQGDENAMAQLTDCMLGYVVEKAFSYVGQGVLLLDLIQEGSLALWQTVRNYQDGDFICLCNRAIARTMANTIVSQAKANGVGQKMRQTMEAYREADARLLGEFGRNPTLEEIAAELHISVEEAAAVEETLEAARMLYRAKAKEQSVQPQPEDEQAVEDTAYFQMRQRIAELLSNLREEDAKLLTLRFGLEGTAPLSPEDTGLKLGLTAQEVVAKEAAALAMLRSK